MGNWKNLLPITRLGSNVIAKMAITLNWMVAIVFPGVSCIGNILAIAW
jgi:hypothetical protein